MYKNMVFNIKTKFMNFFFIIIIIIITVIIIIPLSDKIKKLTVTEYYCMLPVHGINKKTEIVVKIIIKIKIPVKLNHKSRVFAQIGK